MIVFFVFLFAFVPSKTVMISLGDDRLVMLERQKLSAHENNFHFFCKIFELILLLRIATQILQTVVSFKICEVPEVYEVYRLLQTGLFLTDSVFVELVAWFDETMFSIEGY